MDMQRFDQRDNDLQRQIDAVRDDISEVKADVKDLSRDVHTMMIQFAQHAVKTDERLARLDSDVMKAETKRAGFIKTAAGIATSLIVGAVLWALERFSA